MNNESNAATLSPEMSKLLTEMHTIIAPDPVTTLPIAPGWWILLLIIVATTSSIIYYVLRNYRRNAYRRTALSLAEQLVAEPNADFATQVSTLLKRVALAAYPMQQQIIKQAYGEQWSTWLNNATKKPEFSAESCVALANAPYKKELTFDAEALKKSARAWIKNHSVTIHNGGQSHV